MFHLIAARLYILGTIAAAILAVVAQAVEQPIIAAVLALLALPGITSAVTGLILKAAGEKEGPDGTMHHVINPRVIVYTVSAALTGIVVLTTGPTLPVFTGNPTEYVIAWQLWVTGNAETARRIYETLQPIIWPEPA